MLILSVYLTNVKPTDSSASWFSSLKNAERHKFFQKSQFCFFSFSSLIIHCKTLSQSYFIRKVDTAFTKLSSLRITSIALSFTILCTQFTIVNFITNLFQDFLSVKLHDYHSFCDHCRHLDNLGSNDIYLRIGVGVGVANDKEKDAKKKKIFFYC